MSSNDPLVQAYLTMHCVFTTTPVEELERVAAALDAVPGECAKHVAHAMRMMVSAADLVASVGPPGDKSPA